jgi:predicted RNase H-like HicB family nuclease
VGAQTALIYRIVLTRDPDTSSVVAEIPALQIADCGVDVPEALERLQAMATFHLDCLVQEGKPIPTEEREDAGFYLRVIYPPDAA